MDHTKNINDKVDDSKLKAFAGKQMPFDMPEGYFDQLSGKVMDRVHEKPAKIISIRKRMVQLAAAATILILIAFSAVEFLLSPEAETTTETYTLNELYQYSLDNMAELEDSYLISYLEAENLAFSELVTDELDEISDEAIMEYLLAENHIEYYIIDEY